MVCAAIGVALLTAAWRFLTFTGFNNDHYIYLAGAQQIVLGEWPVRDFVDPGWPLMYGVSAVARLLFGRELWVELLVVASAFAIGAGFTLAAAARLSGSIALALMVTLLEIGLNPRSFGYPKLLLYAIAGWAFVAATRQMTPRRAVAACRVDRRRVSVPPRPWSVYRRRSVRRGCSGQRERRQSSDCQTSGGLRSRGRCCSCCRG